LEVANRALWNALSTAKQAINKIETSINENAKTVDKIDKAVGEIKADKAVATINHRIDFLVKLATGLVIVFGLWLGWLSVTVFNMTGDIHAIKQAESIAGTAIVSRLEKPPSIDQLKHDLAITSAKLELQKLTISPKTKIEPSSFKALDTALLQVAQNHPDLPEGFPPACDVNHMKVEQRESPLPNGGFTIAFGYFFSNCTLTLEDIPPQHQDGSSPFPIIHSNGMKVAFSVIHLDNGVVVYRGGAVDNSNDSYVFTNCRFDFSVNGVPPSPVRDLLEAALKQSTLKSVEINLPNAAPA
jgi:hypothetical protein